MSHRRLLPWTIAASFFLHGLAYASLEAPPPGRKVEQRKTQLRFDVVSRSNPVVPEPPPPSPKPRAEPPKRTPPPPRPEARPEPEITVPAPTAPAGLAGLTLAGEGNAAGFSMPLGSGGALDAERPPTVAQLNAPRVVSPAPSPIRTEPALVAVTDLSSRPAPPALGPALERNYPADARRRGLSGTAKVRARIDADGVVRRVALVDESAPGFGKACRHTLTGSRWAPPKDKAGRAVATEIRYTCRFVVE